MSTSPAPETPDPKADVGREGADHIPRAPSHSPVVGSPTRNFSKGTFWVLLFRGVVAVAMGLTLILAPTAVAVILGLYVGAWLIIDGILTIINSNTSRKHGNSWAWELASGIAFTIIGIVIMLIPSVFAVITGGFILWMVAFGVLARGILSLSSRSFRRWSKVLAVLDIVFALALMFALLFNPTATVAALLWIVAVYVIVLGVFLIITAFTVRSQTIRAAAQ